MEQFGVSLMEVVWFAVFLVCCLVVGSGEKWDKGIDRYEVGMLWYRQKSRQTLTIVKGGIISVEVDQLKCEANG